MFDDDLIQQQDLYGAPPVNVKENNVIGRGGAGATSHGKSNSIDSIITPITPVLYGPPSPEPSAVAGKVATGGIGIVLSMVLFIVGLIAMINRKVPTFAKVIIGVCGVIAIAVIIAVTVGIIKAI